MLSMTSDLVWQTCKQPVVLEITALMKPKLTVVNGWNRTVKNNIMHKMNATGSPWENVYSALANEQMNTPLDVFISTFS